MSLILEKSVKSGKIVFLNKIFNIIFALTRSKVADKNLTFAFKYFFSTIDKK